MALMAAVARRLVVTGVMMMLRLLVPLLLLLVTPPESWRGLVETTTLPPLLDEADDVDGDVGDVPPPDEDVARDDEFDFMNEIVSGVVIF